MNREWFERARELHDRVVEMAPDEREAFLRSACGTDDGLRAEVASLLEAGVSAERHEFLDRCAPELALHLETTAFARGDRIGAYEIQERIDAGGSGSVYRALQASPKRPVALKVMHAHLGSDRAVERFREEAEILARLQHPGIATVYESGIDESSGASLPWFAMEFVEGARTLVAHADAEGLDTRERIRRFLPVCEAIQHGHVRGVIHRDLKPGNVLVTPAGWPKVIDFGIARVVAGQEPTEEVLLGTLPYMSPEQCDATLGTVDARTDVYGLGVLLYQLLTGRLPLEVDALPVVDAIRVVREGTIPPPSAHDRRIGRDLDAVLAKALARDPEARYASAASLADDLRRVLAHQPVEARTAGSLYHLGKLVRRHRVASAALALVVVVSIIAAVANRLLAIESHAAREAAELEAYVANLAAAAAALRVDDVGEAAYRLEQAPVELRGWEWHHLAGRVDLSERTITWPGRVLRAGAVGGEDELLGVSSDRRPEAYEIGVLRLRDGAEVWSQPVPARADAMALSSDGRLLGIGYEGGWAEVRRAATGEVVWARRAHDLDVNAVVFDPAGETLATGSRDTTIRLWAAEDGERLGTLRGHEDRVICLDWGRWLVSGGREGVVRVWRDGTSHAIEAHDESVEGVAISPDGTRVATASRDFTTRLFELPSGRRLATGREHAGNVRDVAFSPDGEVFATGSWDRTARIWSAQDGAALQGLRGHRERIERVAFLPGTRTLVTFSKEGTVKLWATRGGDEVPTLRGHHDTVVELAFDGEALRSRSRDGICFAWDPETGRGRPTARAPAPPVPSADARERLADLGEGAQVHTARLSPDGRWIALGHEDGTVRVVDARTLELRWTLTGHSGVARAVAFSPDGRRLASGSEDRTVRLWDLASGRQVLVLTGHSYPVEAVAFSLDGRYLASGDGSSEVPGVIKIWASR